MTYNTMTELHDMERGSVQGEFHNQVVGSLSYVGVTRFVFHVLQLLWIRFPQQNFCCISKCTMMLQR